MNYEGINALSRVLGSETNNRVANGNTNWLDFGKILPDGSLKTNKFPIPIPAGDYIVCHSMNPGPVEVRTSESGGGEYTHSHTVTLDKQLLSLSAGDSVLVAWVGNDAVVIDLIYRNNS